MDILQAKKQIKQGNIAPIYVFYGKENYLVDETLKDLSRQILDEDAMDFNYETFDLQETAIQETVAAAETFPFMGEKRMVVATQATFLSAAKKKEAVEHDVKTLETYVQDPVDHSVLVLLCPEEKLDERKKVVKSLKKQAVVASGSALKEGQLVEWVRQQAPQYEVEMTGDAAQLLLQFVGQNMQALAMEVQKMSHYVGEGGVIDPSVVQELIAKSVEQDVFNLVDHVVQLRMDQAYETLHELLKRNEEPIKILFLLARQFRIIHRVKDLDRQGYSTKQMGSIMKVHPYVCKLALGQGRRFSNEQLTSILDELADIDFQMKTGKMDKVLALEMFLLKMKAKQPS